MVLHSATCRRGAGSPPATSSTLLARARARRQGMYLHGVECANMHMTREPPVSSHETAFAGGVVIVDMLVRTNSDDSARLKLDEVKTCEYTYSSGEALQRQPPPAPAATCPPDGEPFVFEGEHFWDTAAVDDYVHEESTPEIEYWGLAYEDNDVYYFEFSTGRAEWLPPPSIVYDNEVLMWDPNDQWFYLYDPKSNTSRWWVDHFPASSFAGSPANPPDDCISQGLNDLLTGAHVATTEDLDVLLLPASIDLPGQHAVASSQIVPSIPSMAILSPDLPFHAE